VESGHTSQSESERIAEMLGITTPPIRMDSQAKYATVARGEADIYLRLPTRKGYQENIWDHAGGVLLVEEAGGKVTDVHGRELDFSQGDQLTKNQGVIVTNGVLHDAVLAAYKKVTG
jgi:3'(2'), 5'-bisphosphate nucleotidase